MGNSILFLLKVGKKTDNTAYGVRLCLNETLARSKKIGKWKVDHFGSDLKIYRPRRAAGGQVHQIKAGKSAKPRADKNRKLGCNPFFRVVSKGNQD
jgi:hypothetical protein